MPCASVLYIYVTNFVIRKSSYNGRLVINNKSQAVAENRNGLTWSYYIHKLFDGGSYLSGQFAKFVGAHLNMVSEIEVTRFVERHEVYMCMRHIDAYNSLSHLDAGAHLLQTPRHATAEEVKLREQFVVEVEDVVDLLLGNTEHMAADDRVDVEKSETMLGLGHTVAGYLARHYLTKNTCHNC